VAISERWSGQRLLDLVALFLAIVFASNAARPSAQSVPATASVEGRVTFQGTPPQMIVGETGDSQPRLYVDRAGGLRYAVVYLPDARAKGSPVGAAVVMNQRNFVFESQVLAVRAGRVVRFTNDDVANHNVRARGDTPANTFFISTGPGSTGSARHAFGVNRAGSPVPLSCDIHPWMAAWVYVFDHDAFAITGPDGSFRIDNVPPGRHRLAVRQPAGPLTRNLLIDVVARATTRTEIRFTGADIGPPSR
jgi:plastocyanin